MSLTLLRDHRADVHRALHAIAITIADYVQQLGRIGLDGIFYAVTGTANPAMFDHTVFDECSKPYDSVALEAASFDKRILQTCGAHSYCAVPTNAESENSRALRDAVRHQIPTRTGKEANL